MTQPSIPPMRPSIKVFIISLLFIPARYFYVYGFSLEIFKVAWEYLAFEVARVIFVFTVYNLVFKWDYEWLNEKEGDKIPISRLRMRFPPPPPPKHTK